MEPRVVFEDMNVLVVSKPAGFLSQGGSREGTPGGTDEPNLVSWAQGYLGRPYVGLVHRLDRNTSGLMVLGKRTKAADRLTQALQKGSLERVYLAWLVGELGTAAKWTHWLVKDEKTNTSRVLPPRGAGKPHPDAKEAALKVTPVGRGLLKNTPLTLAEFRLETGRSHQIRVQAAHEGFALLGDTKYGAEDAPAFPRHALHSTRLSFPHPISKELLTFEDPLPEDMARLRA
jgi:23S rRNA pseudouridine1911/1915/1917 synthase